MSFLPQNYEIPKNNSAENYLNPSKLNDSEIVRFRILSKPIIGWQYWTNDNKPVRLPNSQKPIKTPTDIQVRDGKAKINHFWAMVVWNYNKEKLQIFEVIQKTIMEAMRACFDDEDYGDPFQYDFKISKTGEALETKYSVMPTPIKPVPDELKEKMISKGLHKIKLEKLYSGEDPFEDINK